MHARKRSIMVHLCLLGMTGSETHNVNLIDATEME